MAGGSSDLAAGTRARRLNRGGRCPQPGADGAPQEPATNGECWCRQEQRNEYGFGKQSIHGIALRGRTQPPEPVEETIARANGVHRPGRTGSKRGCDQEPDEMSCDL